MKKKIAIVDYGLGNLFSVKQAFDLYNIDSVITSNSNEIINSNILVLPGVGSFPEAMKNLKQNNLTETLKEFAKVVSHLLVFVWVCNSCLLKVKNLAKPTDLD